jgi:hypothetical protein
MPIDQLAIMLTSVISAWVLNDSRGHSQMGMCDRFTRSTILGMVNFHSFPVGHARRHGGVPQRSCAAYG